ncbi:hypothetical protein [Luteimonas suaedae]|uniref:hypothetical protein n=1 Tax=Luteimonas suaedae TaxID=2605430 RepID=UPI001659F849|nr:hypothetical protein [Luteimonas suaedae]
MRAIPARLDEGSAPRLILGFAGFAGFAGMARSYEEPTASQRQGQHAPSAGTCDTGVA